MRFLHAGDLHLDSALGAFSKEESARRRERQFVALERMLHDALARGAQMILLAGDCFDTPVPGAAAAARFFDILERCAVPVVIAPGNHDYYVTGGVWHTARRPANVMVFEAPSLAYFDFPTLGVRVYGYAFVAENAPGPDIGRHSDLPGERACILLAHADLTSPLSSYAPLSPGQLEQSGYLYAALGHIHKQSPARKYGNTLAAYSGFFAGRGFDEPGKGQARLVEVLDGAVRETVMESTADTFERRVLDCTGAEHGEALRQRVRAYLEEQNWPRETALRLALEGDVTPGCHADAAALLRLGEGLALFEVEDRTLPLYDADYLEKAPTLQGAYYRALLPRLRAESAEERALAAKALRLGLAALSGREV